MQPSNRKTPPRPVSQPTRPVDSNDASALQDCIATLDAELATLRSRQAQIPERFAEFQAKIDQAEHDRNAAQQRMVQLRNQAVHAQRDPHPELPPGARIELIRPSGGLTDTTTDPAAPSSSLFSLDGHDSSSDALAYRATDLLAQASEAILSNTTEARYGELNLSGGEPVTAAGLDFGPLLDDTPVADLEPDLGNLDLGEVSDTTTTDTAATSMFSAPAQPRPQSTKPAPASKKPSAPASTPALKCEQPASRAPAKKTRDTMATRPVITPAAVPAPRKRLFGPALLAGVILGIAAVAAVTRLPLFESAPVAAVSTQDTQTAPVNTPRQQQRPQGGTTTLGNSRLLQREQEVRMAAHRRFEALRDRLAKTAVIATPAAPVVEDPLQPETLQEPLPEPASKTGAVIRREMPVPPLMGSPAPVPDQPAMSQQQTGQPGSAAPATQDDTAPGAASDSDPGPLF